MNVRSVGYSDGKVNLWIGDGAAGANIRLTQAETLRLVRDLLASATFRSADYPLGEGDDYDAPLGRRR